MLSKDARQYEIERFKEEWMLVTAYIESHGGLRFSIQEVADDTGLTYSTCQRHLVKHPLIFRLKERGQGQGFYSKAPPLESTDEGELEVLRLSHRSILGEQARADFYSLIQERRSQNRRKVIKKF